MVVMDDSICEVLRGFGLGRTVLARERERDSRGRRERVSEGREKQCRVSVGV